MALRLGEDNLPSPGIAIAEGAGLWGNDSPGAAGGGRESWVLEWTLVRARLPPGTGGGGNKPALAERPRGGCAALSFKLWGVFGSGVSEGVANQSPGTGINYANHHLAMDQMTPNTFKKYLAGSSLGDSGQPWLPGQAARERADLVLVQAPSHSPHHPAAEFSRVFIFHLLHLQLSKATALSAGERAAHLGSYRLGPLQTSRGVFDFFFLKSF